MNGEPTGGILVIPPGALHSYVLLDGVRPQKLRIKSRGNRRLYFFIPANSQIPFKILKS